jgi:ATP-binding cassette subfamily B (MDR/TAP) protein 1
LKPITKNAAKYGAYLGIGMGTLFFSILASYSLGFWYGSECVQGTTGCPPSVNGGKVYTAGNVLIVFFSILMSGFNLSQLTPAIKKIAEGRVAAVRIFKLIDRQPLIRNAPNPVIPQDFKGVFKFEDVTFAYPKDKSRKIL